MKTIPTHTKLTDTFTAALPPAEPGKRYLVTDTLVHGLAVSVTDRGSKSYVLVARFGSNNPTRRLIGKVGKIGLARAREIAREWHALIARGKDPAAEIAHQEAAERVLKANTFEAVAMDFIRLMVVGPGYGRAQEEAGEVLAANPSLSPLYALAQVIKDHPPADLKRRSAHVAIRNIDRELLPRLGGKPIASITPRDIVVIFDKAVERGAEPMAHNLYSLVRRIFRWAVSKSVYGLDRSPMENMRPADVIGTKQPRTRWLQHDVEIRTVWRATAALGYPYAQAYRLLMLTGLRRSEIAGARWSEIDLRARLWTVPGSRMKTGQDHEIPLTADMLELLREVPRWAGSDYVFSGTAGKKPINGFSSAKARLDAEVAKIADVEHYRVHDIRRSVRSHLSALPGVSHAVAELILAHSKKGMAAIYDQHAYRDEKRAALEAWNDKLRRIVGEPLPLSPGLIAVNDNPIAA